MECVNQGITIKSKNELLLLDLLIDYSQLKRGDVSRLKKDLPELKELIGAIYGAAEAIDGTFAHKPGNLPVWADVPRRICRDYPGVRTKLVAIEQRLQDADLSCRSLKEIRRDLVLVTNTVIEIHADILRIPIPKNPDGNEAEDNEAPAILDINSLKLIRKSGDFKPRA